MFLPEAGAQQERSQHTAETIRATIADLDRRLAQYASYKHRVYDGFARGITDQETYRRVIAGYGAHETWLQDEIERQQRDLMLADRSALDGEAIQLLYPVLTERLERATDDDERFVLGCLGTRIVAAPEGITLELAMPEHVLHRAVSTIPGFLAGVRGVPS